MRYRNVIGVVGFLILALVAGTWVACEEGPDRDLGPVDPDATDPDPDPERPLVYEVVETVTKVDLLVVVDRSPTMEDEHRALAQYFPEIIEELLNPSDPQYHPVTDLRVGVISQDLGSSGIPLPSCEYGLWSYDGGGQGLPARGPTWQRLRGHGEQKVA